MDERDAVGLRTIPTRVAEGGDGTRVVEERVRVPRRRVEPELVAQIGLTVSAVVDLDLVEDGVVEAVEVRPARGLLERDVVRDHRDRIRVVRADKRVQVGVVRTWVLADQWRLCVARCESAAWPVEAHQDQKQSERNESESRRDQDRLAGGRK